MSGNFFSQTFDIHSAAGSKMFDVLFYLRRTRKADAAVGGFAFMVVDRLRRERGYIEFHNNWAAQYDVAGKKLTVTGRATVISPAAFVDATCKVKIGALSQALRFADIGRHFVIPNASVFTFVAEPFAMPGDATSARLDVTVRLSDGSKKRMRCTVPVG